MGTKEEKPLSLIKKGFFFRVSRNLVLLSLFVIVVFGPRDIHVFYVIHHIFKSDLNCSQKPYSLTRSLTVIGPCAINLGSLCRIFSFLSFPSLDARVPPLEKMLLH